MSLALFVYGTLQRGQRNHHLLGGQRFLGAARTLPHYRLYATGAYPCLVEDPTGIAVNGELWEIDERILPALDALEEAPVLFERRPVELEGKVTAAVAYFYRGAVAQLAEAGSAWPRQS